MGYAQVPLAVDAFNQKLADTPQGQLLDVRTPDEYEQGHLAKSQNLDVKDPVFVQKLATLDKDKPVFVYCLSGGRSGKAAKLLVDNGFKEVYDMQGGFLKWSSAKLPFEKDKNAIAAPTGMSQEEFNKLTASNQPVLIDFYAPWCAPCKKMMPTIEKLTREYAGKATIKTINYDENKALAQSLQVDEIPVFLLYKNGKLLWRGLGEMPEKEFREVIEGNM
ncbi:thioredoxin [Persicitalea jodogahamensis]|uniref:Thioredoxin n=1 Tax=Persicitalea jodogahamensis TaxID=402147 RepID=A0A8J3G789_9BACT|nr:thioredoxin [Persicitalea jodogahamensis]